MKARQWMQIAAVASAIGFTGTAVAHGSGQASSANDETSAAVTNNAPAQLGGSVSDMTPNAAAGTVDDNTMQPGTTQGSTMTSPKSDTTTAGPTGGALYGSGSSATSISGSDRLGSTNSDNFDQQMSDYAAQHNGRITRQEFLDQMGNRWDVVDVQRRGYLTPGEIHELFIVTPGENASPAQSGSEVQPGDMGPGNSKGE